ncbi:DUF721 domain-containing protein [Bartonella tamiae]|uniref:DUF721 domain-containing protein n=1 Tax=Bartonella tamiae Th239 TaxID=1094558 RepID=J0ZPN1_9HYPH|nr:DciA family protein [Bartonella tamiae]EJF90548.1 hypothetical protein ME5_00949 [Bartonella tamiae Th239]EJF94074.1 hypothetical protein MEG_00932 [Bartonella tamiae Th307]
MTYKASYFSKKNKRRFYSLGETAAKMLDPLLRKKAGLNIELIDNWSHIVGEDIAQTTVPKKIIWTKRAQFDEVFEPATLVVICEGYSAMKLTHEIDEFLQRINAFFGYIAINRIKIEQGQVHTSNIPLKKEHDIDEVDKALVQELTADIEDDKLRQSLCNLGLAVFSEKNMSHHEKNKK